MTGQAASRTMLLDHRERVIGALAEPHQRDVGALPRRHRADVLDVDLPRDDVVSERGDDRGDERQAVPALVRDQDPEMLGLAVTHRTRIGSLGRDVGRRRFPCAADQV